MNLKRIITSKEKILNPYGVFALSLLVTGAGQFMINQASRAVLIHLSRNLLIVTASAMPVLMPEIGNPSAVFIIMMIAASALTVISPLHAFISVVKTPVVLLKSYNTRAYFIILMITGMLMTASAVYFLSGTIRLITVSDDSFSPVAQEGEIALVSGFDINSLHRGSAVVLSGGMMTRIIGIAGDTVEIKNNIVFINGFSTQSGILNDDEHGKLSIGYYAGLFKGISGTSVYPVVITPGSVIGDMKPEVVKDDSYFTCRDYRVGDKFCGTYPVDKISGKMCGTVFSGNPLRIGAPVMIRNMTGSQLE